jgi:CSLREA domain-containing protein
MLIHSSRRPWLTAFFQRKAGPHRRQNRRRTRESWLAGPGALYRAGEVLEDRSLLSTITVTSLADNTTSDGLITLREAILAANNGSGADTIVFDAALTFGGPATITLGGTQLELTSDVTIIGPGANQLTIDGNGTSRIFSVSSVATARISGLTLTDGFVSEEDDGGGVRNHGTLTIDRSTIFGNVVREGGGGGISNHGTLTVINSTIRDNLAFSSSGGGIQNHFDGTLTVANSTISGNHAALSGGGIWTNDTITLRHVTITNNLADFNNDGEGSGGGIYVSNGEPVVHNSIISGNHEITLASLNNDDVSGGSLSGSSTYNVIGVGGGLANGVNGNQVGVVDPGLAPLDWHGGPTQTHALLTDSPAIDAGDPGAGNLVVGGMASQSTTSSIHVADRAIDGDLTSFSHTATGDTSASWQVELTDDTPISTVVLHNRDSFRSRLRDITVEVLASNGVDVLFTSPLLNPENVLGNATLNEGPGSLTVDVAALNGAPVTGRIVRVRRTPDLDRSGSGGLGGAAEEHVLTLAEVQVFDSSFSSHDQRGFPFVRPSDGNADGISRIDIGAFEVQQVQPFDLVVDTLVDENDGDYSPGNLSLREAIELSNSNSETDTIRFHSSLTTSGPATITLSGTELAITDDVTITGPGRDLLTIDAQDNSRIFNINDGDGGNSLTVQISGLTATNGLGTDGNDGVVTEGDSGGAITTFESLTLTDVAVTNSETRAGGGGIYNKGTLVVNSSLVRGNTSPGSGGGIENALGSTLTITDTTIAENSALGGGGIYNSNVLTVTDSVVRNNQSTTSGGGIFVRNLPNVTASIRGSVISGNVTASSGGGIHIAAVNTTDVDIENSTISENVAGVDGGGVSIVGTQPFVASSILITGSTISGNRAEDDGGGINASLATLTVLKSTLSGNSAGDAGGGLRGDVADVSVLSSTVTANSAGNSGGGVTMSQFFAAQESDPDLRGILTVTGSIVAGNQADVGPDLRRTGEGTLIVRDNVIGDPSESGSMITAVGRADGDGNQVGALQHFDFSGIFNADAVINDGQDSPKDTVQNAPDVTSLLTATVGSSLADLPDDGIIRANKGDLPFDVPLGYHNDDDGNNAINLDTESDTASFSLPADQQGRYREILVYTLSAGGDGELTVQLNYTDGSTSTISRTVDDWFNDEAELAGDTEYLIDGLNRADNNGMNLNVVLDPAIFFVRIPADVDRTLQSIGFSRNSDGDNLIIFGASGLGVLDPKLGPLKNNGGPTLTHGLLPGSPAIDQGQPAIPLAPSVAWQFEGTSGASATDSAGNHHLVLNGSPELNVVGALESGSGIQFDGTDDFGLASGLTDAELSGDDWSISLWFNAQQVATQSLLAITDGMSQHFVLLELQSNGQIRFLNRIPAGVAGGQSLAAGSYSPGMWHHLTAVRTSGAITLFVDGQQVGTASASGSISGETTVTVGRLSETQDTRYFSGRMDDIAIFNRSLTAPEVRVLAESALDQRGRPRVQDGDGNGLAHVDIGSVEFEPFPSDFGDAPDTGAGTGSGNYQTLATDGGPSHTIVAGLHLGATIDGDDGTLQNARANADDAFGPLLNDEDGVLNPLELRGTVGAAPKITLLVTNTTGSAATLSGWIDYNQDGVFDNSTERVTVAVPNGSTDDRFTLTFPAIPSDSAGTTYARFRLSTDSAGQNSTGPASDGEVEDYVFTITAPGAGLPRATVEINSSTPNGPSLNNDDRFGSSVTSLGDLDGDGVPDLAVGARLDGAGGSNRGAVHVLLLNSDGSVKSATKIAHELNGGPSLSNDDFFGSSLTSLGDLDGDGVPDLAVGAIGDDAGGSNRGAVHVLLLNADGSVKQTVEINSTKTNGPTLRNNDNFGRSVTSLGDLDGDGINDLAVGAAQLYIRTGAVYVLLLNADGSVKQTVEINSTTHNGLTLSDSDRFGRSVTSLGDLDGDGVPDLAVGADGDDAGGNYRGAVHVLLLNANGSVKQTVEINSTTANGPTLSDADRFGFSVTSLGDVDGDGVPDLAVGAERDDAGGFYRGAVHVLLLNADGSVKQTVEINSTTANGPTLSNDDRFGSSVTSLGDLDGDGVPDLAVGAYGDDAGGSNRGAVHILFLSPLRDYGDAPDTGAGTADGDYQTTAADGGPSHVIVSGLHLGNSVIGDDGTRQNVAATADDIRTSPSAVGDGSDDEDGVLNPLDLRGTVGAAPSVTLLVTNTTGSAATLSGWIDYNQDGEFDNATERAQVAVPNGSTDDRFTLTFPAIPSDSTGTTYARFRLSTDAAGQNSIGPASDGEVEDYVFTITAPGAGLPRATVEINSSTPNGPTLSDNDRFGSSVTLLGDLDGDGVPDLAVGATGDIDETDAINRGAVHVLLLNNDGSVKQTVEINSTTTNGPTLDDGDFFGSSVASLGDLDGDGVPDLAVGARFDDAGGSARGAVHVLLLNADGSVKQTVEINSTTANGLTLSVNDFFGRSVTSLGDLDGDGVPDLAVGAEGDDAGGNRRGAVHVLLLNADGSVKQTVEINSTTANGLTLSDNDNFGRSVTSLGDLDGDGVAELAVGAYGDDSGGSDRGAVHILFLNADGSVKQTVEINSTTANGLTLSDNDFFGSSVTSLGDLDGDGVPDLAVGAERDDAGGNRRGAVHVLLLNADGSVKQTVEINSTTANGPTLSDVDFFAGSVTSLGDLDGDGVPDLAVGARLDDAGGDSHGAVHVLFLSPLRDYGDAPDTGPGPAAGDYQTTAADGGPSHVIVSGLHLGNSVIGDDGTRQNATATADDIRTSPSAVGDGSDDEDGVLNPLELRGTIGAAPSVTLLVTNTTGSEATLSGWIDYNQDGDFDNATERAQATISTGTTDQRVTLTFPAIPNGSTGTTYARFRLSTDAAGQNSTGPASDGEVEDYAFEITAPSSGSVDHFLKIASDTNGGPTLANADHFGSSVAVVGDLDGDGIPDLAVGARLDDTGGGARGAVHVLLMNADGTVRTSTKIASDTNGGPSLTDNDRFGTTVAAVGDLDGDGIADLAVGAYFDDTGGSNRGAVHVLLLNSDGTVKSSTKIAHELNGGPTLTDSDLFGNSIASLGDLNGDGVADLAVGARSDDVAGADRGAVYVLLMNSDGTVKSTTRIASGTGGGPALADGDYFGSSLASVGDLDGDGVADLVVGADRDGTGGTNRGAVHVLLLNSDGTVKSTTKIASSTGGGPALTDSDFFGTSLESVGDLNGDGVTDLAVGARDDDTVSRYRGAVHLLLLNSDGTVRSATRIASNTSGGPALTNVELFGGALASLGDLDGDGVTNLAVGAIGNNTGGSNRGAVYILNLAPAVDFGDAPDSGVGTGTGNYQTTQADGGPSHAIVAGLHLGAHVDGFGEGSLQNVTANADDVDAALPDDEDGVLNPLELRGTIGAAPSVTLLVTNTTGS